MMGLTSYHIRAISMGLDKSARGLFNALLKEGDASVREVLRRGPDSCKESFRARKWGLDEVEWRTVVFLTLDYLMLEKEDG